MTNETRSVSAQLQVFDEQGQESFRSLSSEDNLLVGSSQRCGLQLEGPTISAIHCLLKLVDDHLVIQEWSATSGTFINGERIEGEAVVPRGHEIGLGGYRILWQLIESPTRISDAESLASSSSDEAPDPAAGDTPAAGDVAAVGDVAAAKNILADGDVAAAGDVAADDGRATGVRSETPRQVDSMSGNPGRPADFASNEGEVASRCFAAVADAEPEKELDDPWADSVGSRSRDPLTGEVTLEQETIDMLYAEIEQLQTEVSLRDARIVELQAAGDSTSPAESSSGGYETEALVTRLEDLLEEMGRGDERMQVLEDLLQAAEEANQAEQEERHQLESWVAEIEKRIGNRESEWAAELATLEHRIQVITAERDAVEQRLRNAASPASARAESDQMLEQLRQQNAELQGRLDMAVRTNAELDKRVAQLEQESPATQQATIEDALREERAKLAQERAALTRMRAELTAKATEQSVGANQRSNEIESRLRLYRQHLKEIHEEERKPSKSEASLSSRIAGIWKKLDS